MEKIKKKTKHPQLWTDAVEQTGICRGKKTKTLKKTPTEQHWDPNIFLSFQDTFTFERA